MKLSVCVVTYNHERYISRCLDGILSQKTDFDFEILLGEDDSTDDTRSICQEYKERYPDRIRLFLHDRSTVIYIDGRPTGRYNFLYNLERAKGEYVALCEGDDYWTDPLKLQKQVDFLENNLDYSMCFHNTYQERDQNRQLTYSIPMKTRFNTLDFLDKATVRTLSLVYRNGLIKKFPSWFKSLHMADWPLVIMLSTFGDAYYFKEPMGVYVIDGEGVWSGSNTLYRLKGRMALYESMLEYLPVKYHLAIHQNLSRLWPALIKNSMKSGDLRKSALYLSKFIKAPWLYKKLYF